MSRKVRCTGLVTQMGRKGILSRYKWEGQKERNN
jgi:hypothetical protein